MFGDIRGWENDLEAVCWCVELLSRSPEAVVEQIKLLLGYP